MNRVVAFALLVLSSIASAQGPNKNFQIGLMDGSRLREYCQLVAHDTSKMSDQDAMHMNECVYFIDGVIAGYTIGEGKPDLCVPTDSGITYEQIGLVVFKYLEDHPERLHLPGSYLVMEALYRGFPCRSSHAGG